MANLKAIITKNIGTTLTAAYTNTSGADAALKAFNVNLPASDDAAVTANTSGSDWGFIGARLSAISSWEKGHGRPAMVKLSDDRILLLYTDWFNSSIGNTSTAYGGTANRLYCQIIEYQTNKYVAGPISTIILPFNLFDYKTGPTLGAINGNAGYHGQVIEGVAMTPTKVALVVSTNGIGTNNPYLINLNIVGNTVSTTIYSKAINGEVGDANSPKQIEIVPTNTNKVIISSLSGASYQVRAYNVTGSATPTSASAAVVNIDTGFSATYQTAGLSLHRRSDNTYIFAGFTSANTAKGGIFTFDDTLNTFTLVNSATFAGGAVSAANGGMVCVCCSNGTDYNSYILTNTSGTGLRLAQTSATVFNTAYTNFTTPALSAPFLTGFNVTNQTAIVLGAGNAISVTDSTNLLTSVQSDMANVPIVFPFTSRPVYSFCQTTTNNQYVALSRVGITATSITAGTATTTGNYVPWGIPNGKTIMWSDTAGCYFAVRNNRVYALDATGVVLSEVALSSSYEHSGKCISISSTGNIWVGGDPYGCTTNYPLSNSSWTGSVTIAVQNSGIVSTPTALANVTWTGTVPSGATYGGTVALDIVNYGTNSFAFVYGGLQGSNSYPTVVAFGTDVTTPVNIGITQGGAVGTYYGYASIAIVKTSPTTFRYVGQNNLLTTGTTGFLSYTTSSIAFTGLNGAGTNTVLYSQVGSSSTNIILQPAVSRTQSGFCSYGVGVNATNTNYTWVTNNSNALVTPAEGIATVATSLNNIITMSGGGNSIFAFTNSSPTTGASVTPIVQVYTLSTTLPYLTYTGTAGNGYVNVTKPSQYTVGTYGNGLNYLYTSLAGSTVKFTLTINDGTNDFYVTPAVGASLTASNNRSTDVYYVPNGYSVKTKASLANVADSMLEVLEQ